MKHKYPRFFTLKSDSPDVVWKLLENKEVFIKYGDKPFYPEPAWTEFYLEKCVNSIKEIQHEEAALLI